ncbi:WRKY transcription factor, partial [Trifolium medium]|nr:WRKY transcription factor [Trifolium medium]
TQDNPDMYQITYIGIHTCNTNLNNEEVLVNSDLDEVKVLTPSLTIKQEYPKQEPSKVMESDDNADALLVFQSLALEFGDIDFYFDEN